MKQAATLRRYSLINIYLQHFKFPFVLVPHELEGSLGHATAAAAAAAAAASPADSLSPVIVSLDVGGGSFQAQRPLLDAC